MQKSLFFVLLACSLSLIGGEGGAEFPLLHLSAPKKKVLKKGLMGSYPEKLTPFLSSKKTKTSPQKGSSFPPLPEPNEKLFSLRTETNHFTISLPPTSMLILPNLPISFSLSAKKLAAPKKSKMTPSLTFEQFNPNPSLSRKDPFPTKSNWSSTPQKERPPSFLTNRLPITLSTKGERVPLFELAKENHKKLVSPRPDIFYKQGHKEWGNLKFQEFSLPGVRNRVAPLENPSDSQPLFALISRGDHLPNTKKLLWARPIPIEENTTKPLPTVYPSLTPTFSRTLPCSLGAGNPIGVCWIKQKELFFRKKEQERQLSLEAREVILPYVRKGVTPGKVPALFALVGPTQEFQNAPLLKNYPSLTLSFPESLPLHLNIQQSEISLASSPPPVHYQKFLSDVESNRPFKGVVFPTVALKVSSLGKPEITSTFALIPRSIWMPNTKKLLQKNSAPYEQKEKGLTLTNSAYITLNLSKTLVSHLNTEGKFFFDLSSNQVIYKAPLDKKLGKTLFEKLLLPTVPLAIIPLEESKGLTEVDENLVRALIVRNVTLPNAKKILWNVDVPVREEKYLTPEKSRLQNPLRPAHYPPETPSFAFDIAPLEIHTKSLEYLKEPIESYGISTKDLALPYLREKGVMPNKYPMAPKKLPLQDLFPSETLLDLAARVPSFSNTLALLSKTPLPSTIDPQIDLGSDKIHKPETTMVRSQSKEILEHYEQENVIASRSIPLSKPAIKSVPTDSEVHAINKSSRFTNAFLTEIPPPSYLETATYDNEFETEVHYTQREDGKGYHFALKMRPNKSLSFGSPNQHVIFVVDGSSSIKKHRFGTFKEGVARALPYLNEGDSFNIIVADSKLISFSKGPMRYNKNSVAKAKRFLNERNYRGFFINYDAFDLLAKVTDYFDPERENIVILLTDGHSFNTLKHHKEDFQELSRASKGKFSIFTATASQSNNLSMLDLVSTFNNGELMYSKTNAAFSRQLAKLVRHIEHFIAKDVHIHTTSPKQTTGIEFYPNATSLPSLYSDRPYIVYGTIDELKDFDLILQGRSGEQWINIKQHVTFRNATKASYSIQKGFALQQAYICYDYFLKKDNPFFLSEAERILDPFAIPTVTR